MISELLNLEVDVSELQKYFLKNVQPLAPIMQSQWFGGWSILSKSGSYKDGWTPGHLTLRYDGEGNPSVDPELIKRLGVVSNEEHCNPTEVCTGYMLQVIDQIRALGLVPHRARWSLLKAQGQSTLHRDSWTHRVRLHIPVITNSSCTFESEGEVAHMPANNGVHLLRVNRLHQIFNRGKTDRIHIIMDVRDERGISKYHKHENSSNNSANESTP